VRGASDSNLLVVGVVRDCAAHLKQDVDRIGRALAGFASLRWFVVESDSNDSTAKALEEFSTSVSNFQYVSLGRLRDKIPRRTERLAFCRNVYLSEIEKCEDYQNVHYVIVADLDGVNTLIATEGVKSCWNQKDWDVCTANQSGAYFDVWALRHNDWSPNDCWAQKLFLDKYCTSHEHTSFAAVYSKMISIPPESDWIQVESAFGGFAIYRRDVIRGAKYVGLTTAGNEICEHVPFHLTIGNQGGKIFINPKLINGSFNEHSRPAMQLAQRFSVGRGHLGRGLAKRILGKRGIKAAKFIRSKLASPR
jgi:hypothetical protein